MNAILMKIDTGDSNLSMPFSRILRAYIIESKYAFLSALRSPVFSIPMIALPIFLYLLLGGMVFRPGVVDNPNASLFLFSGFLVFAVSGPGLFGFGAGLAAERQSGVLKLKRAQPMPPAACLVAKMVMAMGCTGIAALFLIPLAIWIGPMDPTVGQIAGFMLLGILGVLPFCAIGFLIGTLVSGTAAPGIVNIIFFPMLYLSGMFFPLPGVLKSWAVIWPTYHLNQIAGHIAGLESGTDIRTCSAILLGITVVCTVLAARRFARVG
jgi:ABC-2 type transport system permease protein